MSGNLSTPEVAGSGLTVSSDGGVNLTTLVAEPNTEVAAEAEAIGRVGQQDGKPAVETHAPTQATGTADTALQPESVEEPVQTVPDTAEEQPLTPEQIKALRAENRNLQALKDKAEAARLAEQFRVEQERQRYQQELAAYNKKQQEYQAYLDKVESDRQAAQRAAEEAELQRMVAAAAPEVQAAYKVAIDMIQKTEQRRQQQGHQQAITRMNRLMMDGIPGTAFAGLPQDRPLEPWMVDTAATRYLDWQQMQDTASRPKFKDVLAQVKNKPKTPTAPQAPIPPTPPTASRPVAPPARVTPGTGGRPPSNLERQFDEALAQAERGQLPWAAVEKLRRQLGVQLGEQTTL